MSIVNFGFAKEEQMLFENIRNLIEGSRNGDRNHSSYDPQTERPILHKSICTGETTAGFRNLTTGKYTDIMLIRSEADLLAFMEEYGISERPETEY